MWDSIQFILLLTAYGATSYFFTWLIKRYTIGTNKYIRLLLLSYVYALFWGIGIAGTGGEPGFGFPAPNIFALGLMASIGFHQGILTGLIVLGFWWAIIFVVMFVNQIIKKRKTIKSEQQ